MGNAADEAAQKYPDLLRLENLDTDLRPPQAAIKATIAAVEADENNSYLPFAGQNALREAVARHVSNLSGVQYEPHQCLITAGGLNGCLVTLLALLDRNDEVILTDPTYVGMINRVRLAGGVTVLVPYEWTGAEWRLNLDALKKSITTKTRAVFLMNPSMPSGAVLNEREWQAVADICKEADLWLVYNAAMERILYDGHPYIHPAGLAEMSNRTITIGSASKEFRMIGWRIGWVVGPAEVLEEIGRVSISDVVVSVGIAQPAAVAAITSADADADLAAAVMEWQRRRDLMVQELADFPLRNAAGGWSMLLDAGQMNLTGAQASNLLMEHGHVAATPMDGWGIKNGAQFLRLVFSNEPLHRLIGIGDRFRRAFVF
ncbi:MAG TPA: pyridoxal phosphate-dependent aminotransferase [Acidobacteriota bacterium]|nr:pyridoxal phosphate-dependent aminotransferase [Acidobacteriota bacterium]